MGALKAGERAPDFRLESLSGARQTLATVTGGKPALLFFFKTGCPTCQLATPFVERLARAYGGSGFRVVGLSQNDREETEAYRDQYGMTFEVLLDFPGWRASEAYGLDTVPSCFVVGPDGAIRRSFIGWQKRELLEVGRLAAAAAGVPEAPLFRREEAVPDMKAG
jgi:peroxiredoxin Q/BCP